MRYARYIGRVAGLAAALGIGAAIAGFGGIAAADETVGTKTNSDSGQKAESADATGARVEAGTTARTDTGTARAAQPIARTDAGPPVTNTALARVNEAGHHLQRMRPE
jgi:aldose sugar dehydrogenase